MVELTLTLEKKEGAISRASDERAQQQSYSQYTVYKYINEDYTIDTHTHTHTTE